MTSPRKQFKGKILLIEDNSSQAELIRSALDRLSYTTLWAPSGTEGLMLAQSESPDLILLDLVMDDMDGFAVCRWLKINVETRDIPVIMLSARNDLRDRIESLHVGAHDYVPKPFADEELEARIFAALRVRSAQAELKQRNSELELMLHRVEAMAITDPLTGLFNRRRFADVLKNQFAVTRRYKNPLSFIMLDIDHFKSINDRYGHDVGDHVLKLVAQKLSENLREVDVAARYGGEEYAVLLPHTSKENALIVADRLLTMIRRLQLDCGGASLTITASLGLAASTDLGPKGSADSLVKAADTALYQAKGNGRDRVVLYHPNQTTSSKD